jgi:hypothetical protein
MRTIHWLFVVSVALFISGVGFVIAGARSARQAPAAAAPAISVTPVASIKQIMKGIVGPASTAVFNSVSTTVSIKGIEEEAPQTDAEWEALGNSGAALSESGNLILIGGRAIDNGDWVTQTQAMIEAGKAVLKATQEKNPMKVLEAGEALNASCDNCHRKYQRGS